MANTIIKRVGGKSKMTSWIRSLLPYHTIYCEPFGGSFSVGLSMPRPTGSSYRLVYNDSNEHVSNFFRVLRDRTVELKRLVELSPYSRSDFESACRFIKDLDANVTHKDNIDTVEWARNYLIFNRQSFSGKEDGTWSIAREGENTSMTWAGLPPMISELAQSLKGVYIECGDYKEVIQRWDSEQTLIYCDPPYLGVEKEFYLPNKESGFCHQSLADTLKHLKSSWAVSYYDSEYIRELYNGYIFHTKEVKKHMQRTDKKSVATEILIVHKNQWARQNEENQCFANS